MSELQKLWAETVEGLTYSPEGIDLLSLSEAPGEQYIYVLLTDTKTMFSRFSKALTGQPYNHVSLMLTENFDDPIYTFSLSNGLNGIWGGFMVETREELKGSKYSLYRLGVTIDVFQKIQDRVVGFLNAPDKTKYNHLGLFNAIFQKNIFSSDDAQVGICSEFVVEVLKFGGVSLFGNRAGSTVRPYDLVKSKLLKFHKRGTIK